ncbi:MAG: CinA family protein [Gammaproteobacteria bacterium]|nr:CinA family protein [Gammaproteobacteria bacterium]
MTAEDHTQTASIVHRLAQSLLAQKQSLAVAESCTGGWLAKSCTDLAGSSQWFERGLVTYSNASKVDLLAVPLATIEEQGAVSEATVSAMVAGLLDRSPADWVIAVSGVAGPDGGSPINPVGSVWFAWQQRGHAAFTSKHVFAGNREAIRESAVNFAIVQLIDYLK